jgi:hypothetical protein
MPIFHIVFKETFNPDDSLLRNSFPLSGKKLLLSIRRFVTVFVVDSLLSAIIHT